MPPAQPLWLSLFWLAMAGALGTLARYGVATLMDRICGQAFAWGTLVVNVVGCFLFGLVWMLAEERQWISGHARWLLLTGFMGAFTTYSTFAFETGQYLRHSACWLALANVGGQLLLGLLALATGFVLARHL